MSDLLRQIVADLRERVAGGDALVRAFAVWLGVATDEVVLGSTGLWLPREVATAGLLRGVGRATPRPFTNGLAGLMRCSYFDPNLPPGFESDPLSMFGVAVGIRATGTAAARAWLLDLLDRALAGERDEWRVAVLRAGRSVLGEPSDAGVVLRVALAARGLASPVATDIEEAVRVAASTSPCLPEEAAVRLAVLDAAARLAAAPHPPRPPMSESPVKLVKILFLASNPMGSARLDLHQEIKDIQTRLRVAEHRDAFDFVSEHAVSSDDLDEALLRHRPVIVHFSGHGAGGPGIVLHGPTENDERKVDADALADLFRILKDDVRIVVLNACLSLAQATAIVREIDFVVGMADSIGDEAARKFAAAFYRALAFGRSVQEAFDLGVNALKRDRLVNDVTVPRLFVRPGASARDVLAGTRSDSPRGPPAWLGDSDHRGDVRRHLLRSVYEANEQGASGVEWCDSAGNPGYQDVYREACSLRDRGLVEVTYDAGAAWLKNGDRFWPSKGVLRIALTAEGRELVEAHLVRRQS